MAVARKTPRAERRAEKRTSARTSARSRSSATNARASDRGSGNRGSGNRGSGNRGSERGGSSKSGGPSKGGGSSKSGSPSKSRGSSKSGSSKSGGAKNGSAKNGRRQVRKKLPGDPEEWLSLDSEELLEHYARSRSRRDDVRIALVERHLADVVDMARLLAARLPRSVDLDDLCNAGYSGLLRSIETWDPGKGRSFVSYLRTRVHGSMVDELRAMDWLPRLMRSRLARRDQVAEELRQERGRTPTEAEIAARLGVSIESYRRSYPVVPPAPSSGFTTGSDDELDRLGGSIVGLGTMGQRGSEDPHPLTPMYQQELIERIQELLTETEWQLVELHYFEGLKLREVAKRLALSPARICQIHGRVLQRLKEKLREEAPTI